MSASDCCQECRTLAVARGLVDLLAGRMIVCPNCGNKRCPKATWHAWACTGSNEPHQQGSAY